MTTFRLEAMTSVTESPTNAHPYCVASVPRPLNTPPDIANKIEGQLSCIFIFFKKKKRLSCIDQLKFSEFSINTSLIHWVHFLF